MTSGKGATMKGSAWLVAGVLLGLSVVGAPRAAPDAADKTAAPMKAKRDAARKTFEVAWIDYREGRGGLERLYWWSRRWMESEQQLAGQQKPELLAAAQGHFDRMREVERVIQNLEKRKVAVIDEVTAAEFYRLEADLWVRQAKN
jgi:hypothetical protein